MVEKRPRAALCVLDKEPPPALDPHLRMRARDDLGAERELVRAQCVHRREPEPRAVREAANAQRRVALPQVACDGVEPQRAPGVEVWD